MSFHRYYSELGNYIFDLLHSNIIADKRRSLSLIRLEYENFYFSLQIALSNQYSVLEAFRLLNHWNLGQNSEKGIELCRFILEYIKKWQKGMAKTQCTLTVIDALGTHQVYLKDFKAAETSYREVLLILEDLTLARANMLGARASILHKLGIIVEELREFDRAEEYYKQAIDLFEAAGMNWAKAPTFHQLGMVLQKQNRWNAAMASYQESIKNFEISGDRIGQAKALHQLGMIARQQWQFNDSINYFLGALKWFRKYANLEGQALILHELSILEIQCNEWELAEKFATESLRLNIEISNDYSQSGNYQILGTAAEAKNDFRQAYAYYEKALNILNKYKDYYSQASLLVSLGLTLQKQKNYSLSCSHFLNALSIYHKSNNLEYQNITLHYLVHLYLESGDDTLPAAIAGILGITLGEAAVLLTEP